MQTAESFTALGAGNSFPFCLPVVDVSTLDPSKAWVTLSGFKQSTGGSPTPESVAESRRLAMLYFWNAQRLNGTTHDLHYLDVSNPEVSESPKDRICLSSSDSFYAEEYPGVGQYGEESGIVLHLSGPTPFHYFSEEDGLFAMYNGSELIGYGVGGGFAFAWDSDSLWSAEVRFGSVQHKSGDPYGNDWNKYDVKYTTMSMGNETIHVIGEAESYAGDSSGTMVADAANLYAADYANDPTVEASIDSITLHTY